MEINFVGRLKEGSFSEPPGKGSRRSVQNSISIANASKLRAENQQSKINQQAALQPKQNQKPQTKKALTVTS
jgi:hypothetical protein